MDRLKYVIYVSGFFPLLAGGLVTLVLALGFYSVEVILLAAGVGVVLAFPASYFVSRKIKREDPNFDHSDPPQHWLMPDANAKEA